MAICTEYLNAFVLYHINLRGIEGASLLTLFLGRGSEWYEVCGQHENSLEKSPSSRCQMSSLKGEEQHRGAQRRWGGFELSPIAAPVLFIRIWWVVSGAIACFIKNAFYRKSILLIVLIMLCFPALSVVLVLLISPISKVSKEQLCLCKALVQQLKINLPDWLQNQHHADGKRNAPFAGVAACLHFAVGLVSWFLSQKDVTTSDSAEAACSCVG